jgi:uncharacterized protein involved in copper resistance
MPAVAARQPALVHKASVLVPAPKALVEAKVEPKPTPEAKKKLAETKAMDEPKKKLAEAKPAAEPKKKLADAKAAPAPAKKKAAMIDDKLVSDIRAAAKAETKGSGGGQ